MALGYLLRTAPPNIMPSILISSTYSAVPKTFFTASTLKRLSPINPLEISPSISTFSLNIFADSKIACSIFFFFFHLNILFLIAFFTSDNVGLRLTSSKAFALITIPGIQKPHCTAPTFANA